MCTHADGPDSGAAAAVWNAEGLVQIQVADICANRAGTAQSDLRVHVGTIHVDLAAVAVDGFANVADALFEHTVRGRIGHHQCGEFGTVFLGFGAQVIEINVAIVIALDGHYFHSCHDSAGGIGAMR